jgi:hypothetical protein
VQEGRLTAEPLNQMVIESNAHWELLIEGVAIDRQVDEGNATERDRSDGGESEGNATVATTT